MKIMSFNTQHCLNFVEQKIDFPIMAEVIKRLDADFIGLNEMRGEGKHPEYTAQTERLAALTGIENYFFGKAIEVGADGPYGNAFLSKIPVERQEVIPVIVPENERAQGHWYENRCLIKARLENGITALVIHFGHTPEEDRQAVKMILENMEKEKCVLMGDFNLSPDSEFLKPLREVFVDTADFFSEPKLSFNSVNPTVKIDYVFVTPDIKVISADIPEIIASDHRPYIVEIEF